MASDARRGAAPDSGVSAAMTMISDILKGGYWPLRHHEKDFSLNLRVVRYACAVSSDMSEGLFLPEDSSAGDVQCAVLWGLEEDSDRPCPSWSWAWPTVASEPKDRADDDKAFYIRPTDKDFEGDSRYVAIEPKTPEWAGKFPIDWPGIVCAATHENDQVELFFPSNYGIVADNRGDDDFNAASRLFDIDADGRVDEAIWARVHSAWMVVQPRSSFLEFSASTNDNCIAWQLGNSGDTDRLAGFGLCVGPSNEEQQRAAQAPEDIGGVYSTVVRGPQVPPPKKTNRTVAAASSVAGGPFFVGQIGDQHQVGATQDQEPINSVHIVTNSLFYGHGGDAPLDFEPLLYREPIPMPHRAKVHLRYDPAMPHSWVGGMRMGKWRWVAEAAFYFIDGDGGDGDGDGDYGDPYGEPGGGDGGTVPRYPGSELGGFALPGGQAGEETPAGITPIGGEFVPLPFTPTLQSWHPEAGEQPYIVTSLDAAFPGVLFRAHDFKSNKDIRKNNQPSAGELRAYDKTAPIVARIEPLGKQATNRGHDYTVKPAFDGRYRGGSSSGSLVFMPAEVDLTDLDDGLQPTDRDRSSLSIIASLDCYWGSGTPSISGAPIQDGWVWRSVGNDISFQQYINGSTAATGQLLVNGSPVGGGGSGESNTASNIGAGASIFSSKVGVDLQFNGVAAASAKMSVALVANDIEVDLGSVDINDLSDVSIAGAASGEVLTYNGASWDNQSLPVAPVEFNDSTFRIYDDGDNTKMVSFQASGITTATVRELAIQDADYTLSGLETAQDFTATNIFSGLLNASGQLKIPTSAPTTPSVGHLWMSGDSHIVLNDGLVNTPMARTTEDETITGDWGFSQGPQIYNTVHFWDAAVPALPAAGEALLHEVGDSLYVSETSHTFRLVACEDDCNILANQVFS